MSPLSADFLARWKGWYPDAPPVGFLLREAYPDRWLRIHALREAKRSPTSGWDYADLVRRYNSVATYVLGPESSCALLLLCECRSVPRLLEEGCGLDTNSLFNLGPLAEEWWADETGVFATPMCLVGGPAIWHQGTFDRFFFMTAQNKVRGLLVERERGQVVAPYDGGADLFFATSWERDVAKDHFAPWLSPHPEGL